MRILFRHFILLTILIIPASIRAELLHGTGMLYDWTWDFSDSSYALYPDSNLYADIFMFMTARTENQDPTSPTWFYVASNYEEGAWITAVPDTSLEDLRVAPENLDDYTSYLPAYTNITYVVRTVEGHYVKFQFTHLHDLPNPEIEYYYQTNGSRILCTIVGTEISTWGRIKKVVLPRSK